MCVSVYLSVCVFYKYCLFYHFFSAMCGNLSGMFRFVLICCLLDLSWLCLCVCFFFSYKLSFPKNIYTLTTLSTNLKLHSYCLLTACFFFRYYFYITTILGKSQITCLFFSSYLSSCSELFAWLFTHNSPRRIETTYKAQLSNQTDIDWKKSAHSLCLIWSFGYVWLLFSSYPRTYRYRESHTSVRFSLHFCCY